MLKFFIGKSNDDLSQPDLSNVTYSQQTLEAAMLSFIYIIKLISV